MEGFCLDCWYTWTIVVVVWASDCPYCHGLNVDQEVRDNTGPLQQSFLWEGV